MSIEQPPQGFVKLLVRLFSVQAIGLVCGFLSHLLLARMLAPEQYGVFNFIFSSAMLCALLGNFGFQASSVRLIPQFTLAKQASLLRKFYGFSFAWVLGMSTLAGLGLYGLYANVLLSEDYTQTTLIIGVILVLFIALIKLNSGVLKGFKKESLALTYESGLKEILLLGFLAIVFLAGFSMSSAVVVLIALVCIFLGLLITSSTHAIALVRPLKPVSEEGKKQQAAENIKDENQIQLYRRWLRISLPMMLVISAQMLIHRSDIVLLGLLSSASDVGLYSAGAKLAQAATIAMMALNIVFSPRAAEAFHQNDTSGLCNLYGKIMKLQAISTATMAICIALGAQVVLNFIGTEYAQALPVVYVLLTGYVLNAFWDLYRS